MDTLRGSFDGLDAREDSGSLPAASEQPFDLENEVDDTPPPAIGNDERRMQVRAYNHWASSLEDGNYPHVDSLDPEGMEDFGPYGVLLDFSQGVEDPIVTYVGSKIAEECGTEGTEIGRLSDVPSRSLLSRITDHYMQIHANQAPIGFEAEFVNQRGKTVLYRGILLPYSTNDETIDFIYGVINWKELADQKAAEELLLEIDQVLEAPASPIARREEAPTPIVDWADGPGAEADIDFEEASFEPVSEQPQGESQPASHEMALHDWLAAAREKAQLARETEDRSRNALYDAIGRAWDFALAAAAAPEDFAEMVEDAGLSVQERAPMTPVVKLVFGADYDKTRLTEYAAALSHAQRLGLGEGALAGFLRTSDGGLKGVVAAERAFRRSEAGKPEREITAAPRKAIARKLRALAAQSFDTLNDGGDEFALVMVRRNDAGGVELLGEVPGDAGLIERAARKLID